MIGRAIGSFFIWARDHVARGLICLHVTPNKLTLAGMVFTAAAGACYAAGSSSSFGWSLRPGPVGNLYMMGAFWLLILASACDMLDGAVARIGNLGSKFGAFLDSTLDRYSDFAVFCGIACCYAWQRPANVTLVFLSMLAFFNSFMISYARARAEDIIEHCTVGYWQRGERSAAILIATAAHNIPALVVQQALSPLFTVLLRIFYTKAVIEGRAPVTDPRLGGWWLKIRLWRWPRMTVPYDIITGLNIAWLIFVRIPAYDPLRAWLGG